MAGMISIGELRQNPTRMLREVKSGATYTITDHGEPVAQVTAVRPRRWVPSADVDTLLKQLGDDDDWARELAADRAGESVDDPWASQA